MVSATVKYSAYNTTSVSILHYTPLLKDKAINSFCHQPLGQK